MGVEKLFLVTQLPPAEKCEAIAEPEVIEGNMKALECAYDVVEAAIEEDNQISA